MDEISEGIAEMQAYRHRVDNPHEWASEQIDAQLDAYEEQTGQALDEGTANLIGRLAYEHRGSDGVPSVEAALGQLADQESDAFETVFDQKAERLEERLGRKCFRRRSTSSGSGP